MKKKTLTLILLGLIGALWAMPAVPQDYLYLSEPSLTDTPRIVPLPDPSLRDEAFRDNPALLKLDRPYRFIYDAYYLGSGSRVSTDAESAGYDFGGVASNSTTTTERKYLTTVLGTSTGFVLNLGDRSNLALVADYRHIMLRGNGNFATMIDFPVRLDGTTGEKYDSENLGLMLRYNYVVGDTLTVGAGLDYEYRHDMLEQELSAGGFDPTVPGYDFVDTNRRLLLKYHRIAPVVGVSFVPADRFGLDAAVSVGLYRGGVHKDADMYESIWGDPTYVEDLDSNSLSGWDVSAKIRPLLRLTDSVSIPLTVDFAYRDVRWDVFGATEGYMVEDMLDYVYHGAGDTGYEDDEATWHITGGAGLDYDAGWARLSTLFSYTRWEYLKSHSLENYEAGWLAAFTRRDAETRDILSAQITLEKEFSKRLTTKLGLRYDVGWVYRDYYYTYRSDGIEMFPGTELVVRADGRDVYQNLTLTASADLEPIDDLRISFLGSVTAPLDALDYDLSGTGGGAWYLFGGAGTPRFHSIDGAVSRDYDYSGWDWGVTLSISYEFGRTGR